MMEHDDRDHVDLWTAVAIGAVIGIGTALIVRARQEDETSDLLRRLQPVRKRAQRTAKAVRKSVGRTAHRAGDATDDLVSAGREILDELRRGAADIVSSTRDELQKAASDSLADARAAARKAARRVTR
jgi:gas vesicle protein